MHIVNAEIDRDLIAIQGLLNEVIATSTALYDYNPRPLEQVRQWMLDKISGNLPIKVAIGKDGLFLGFATFGPFRPHPAYKYTVEHSIYVSSHARGKGIGKALLQDIIAEAELREKHLLVAAIDAQNSASLKLHESFGFTRAGILKESGFKFGRWLDLILMQKRLDTPLSPVDSC